MRCSIHKIGFVEDRQKGSHITLIQDDPHGRVTVPYNSPLKSGTLRSIIRQAGLTVDEFVKLL